MSSVEFSIDRIRNFISSHPKWNRFRMAREAGLSPNSLRDLNKPDWNPTVGTVRAVEAVIDAYEAQGCDTGETVAGQ